MIDRNEYLLTKSRRYLAPDATTLAEAFLDAGAFRAERLQRLPPIEIFKCNSISEQIRTESESAVCKRDRMRLAFYYHSLLDSG